MPRKGRPLATRRAEVMVSWMARLVCGRRAAAEAPWWMVVVPVM